MQLGWKTQNVTSQTRQYDVLHQAKLDDNGLLNGLHPLVFAAKANADDNPNFHQAMNGPDSEGFYEAMKEEMDQLESMDAWEIVPRDTAQGHNVLDTTWVF